MSIEPKLSDFSDHSEDPATALGHENLDVYRIALDFAASSEEMLVGMPKEAAHLCDQLRRSSSSIVLNIAEGAGRSSPNDKARFYAMARGSATESAATTDLLYRTKRVSLVTWVANKELAKRIVSMLTRLMSSELAKKK